MPGPEVTQRSTGGEVILRILPRTNNAIDLTRILGYGVHCIFGCGVYVCLDMVFIHHLDMVFVVHFYSSSVVWCLWSVPGPPGGLLVLGGGRRPSLGQ